MRSARARFAAYALFSIAMLDLNKAAHKMLLFFPESPFYFAHRNRISFDVRCRWRTMAHRPRARLSNRAVRRRFALRAKPSRKSHSHGIRNASVAALRRTNVRDVRPFFLTFTFDFRFRPSLPPSIFIFYFWRAASNRRWANATISRIGRRSARTARRKPCTARHLDETFVTLRGEPYLLWRAVDEHAAGLDVLVQRRAGLSVSACQATEQWRRDSRCSQRSGDRAPNVLRRLCVAMSAVDFPPNRPSTWSGAIGLIASGAIRNDTCKPETSG